VAGRGRRAGGCFATIGTFVGTYATKVPFVGQER